MSWVALACWILTATGGAALGLQWLRHGGAAQQTGIRRGRLLPHAGVAVLGLAVWIGFIATDRTALAWLAIAMLLGVALIGLSMLRTWSHGRGGPPYTEMPAEASFPVIVVLAHGLLGIATIAASIVAALAS